MVSASPDTPVKCTGNGWKNGRMTNVGCNKVAGMQQCCIAVPNQSHGRHGTTLSRCDACLESSYAGKRWAKVETWQPMPNPHCLICRLLANTLLQQMALCTSAAATHLAAARKDGSRAKHIACGHTPKIGNGRSFYKLLSIKRNAEKAD